MWRNQTQNQSARYIVPAGLEPDFGVCQTQYYVRAADAFTREQADFDEARRINDQLWRQILSLRSAVEARSQEIESGVEERAQPQKQEQNAAKQAQQQKPAEISPLNSVGQLSPANTGTSAADLRLSLETAPPFTHKSKEESEQHAKLQSELSQQYEQQFSAQVADVIAEQENVQQRLEQMRGSSRGTRSQKPTEREIMLEGELKRVRAAHGMLKAKYSAQKLQLQRVCAKLNQLIAEQAKNLDSTEAQRQQDSRKQNYDIQQDASAETRENVQQGAKQGCEPVESTRQSFQSLVYCPRDVFERFLALLERHADDESDDDLKAAAKALLNQEVIRLDEATRRATSQDCFCADCEGHFSELDVVESVSDDFLGFSVMQMQVE